MKITVLGAGVVGTAAAYYLAADGHEVTVIERHPAPARGTSQSNAGLVSP
ncbi:FAD-dependent oxidoreductase, partial [Mesorhizobium sp. M00.F.Ca.ET.158.01.1.1]